MPVGLKTEERKNYEAGQILSNNLRQIGATVIQDSQEITPTPIKSPILWATKFAHLRPNNCQNLLFYQDKIKISKTK